MNTNTNSNKKISLKESRLKKCSKKELVDLLKILVKKTPPKKQLKSKLIESILTKLPKAKKSVQALFQNTFQNLPIILNQNDLSIQNNLVPADSFLEKEKLLYNELLEKIDSMKKDLTRYKENRVQYLDSVDKALDESVYGMNEAKTQIKRIIAQWINGDNKGYIFGFEGPPGTGKTTLAKLGISKAISDDKGSSRPFSFIALGGSSNGSTLEGHNYTYVGSTWGKIVDTLMTSKCMNPIIYIDELDKVSKTEHGKEIIGILTHMTDTSQNEQFSDKYFSGIKIDISKCLIIFSYNDVHLIDKILLDRIHRVKIKSMKQHEKIQVLQNYIFPQIIDSIGFKKEDIILEDSELIFIIDTYTCEAGVRKLKEKVFELLREVNLRYLMNEISDFPFTITIDFIKEIFSHKQKIQYKKIPKFPAIGIVNGLFATNDGLGGIIQIECYKFLSESKLSLELTGLQGDVMKESMKVSKTVAWNLLTLQQQKNIRTQDSFGLHIHCPEASTPKDGPSAGAAITLAIYSLFTGKKIKNNFALTGEIDLNGTIQAIGGLDLKIGGARRAGATTILCPKENKEDLEKILNDPHYPKDENFTVYMVETIQEVIKYMILDNETKNETKINK
jgi:endopeptidase La